MGWPDRYRRQAHIALVNYESCGLPFFFHAAQTYKELAEEAEARLAERKAEDSNPSA